MNRLLLGCVILGGALMGHADEGAKALRIVTYNIHHGEGGDHQVDLERIAGVLLALGPDVVCLQEVDRNLSRTDRRDFPAEFEQLLGMPGVFESNYDFDGGEYGNAIFTKLPVASHENHALPGPEGIEPRGCIEAVVEWNGAKVRVMNTHLGLSEREREGQTEAIAALLDERPTVVCGDFNETPGRPAMQTLEAKLTHCRLTDTLEEKDLTFSAQRPSVRIDHVLANAGLKCLGIEVIRNEVTAIASDHLPVLAVLERAE